MVSNGVKIDKNGKQPSVRTVRARKCKFRVPLAVALWKNGKQSSVRTVRARMCKFRVSLAVAPWTKRKKPFAD